jgi:hypothetical protein
MNDQTLPVVLERELSGKGMLGTTKLTTSALENVGTQLLSDSFQHIIQGIDKIVGDADLRSARTSIAEIAVTLEIRADVGFAILGSVTAGAQGSIQVTLKVNNGDDSVHDPS